MVGELRKVEDENCLHRDGCQHGKEHHPGRVRGRVRLCLLKRKPGQRCKDSRTSSLGRTDAAKNVFYALPKFMLRLCNKFQFPPYKLYNCARQEALLRL